MKLIFALIILLLFVWRIKRGFANGIMGEIVTIVSGAVALICVVLIFFAVTSVRAKAMYSGTDSAGDPVQGMQFDIQPASCIEQYFYYRRRE